MPRSRFWWLALASTLFGCSEGAMPDGGSEPDGFVGTDASADAWIDRELDAPRIDVSADDAWVDAGVALDARVLDARVDANAPRELCNRLDDDRDGQIDESACRVCRGCEACTSTVRGDRVYLVCPIGTIGGSGILPWVDTCERLAPGYELIDLSDVGESLWLASVAVGRIGVGIQDFGLDGQLRDSHGAARDITDFTLDPAATMGHCFAQTRDGLRRVPCPTSGAITAVACEAPVTPPECAAAEGQCDGRDDNCNGQIDEGVCPTSAQVTRFAGHQYTTFETAEFRAEAEASCQALPNSRLAMIDTEAEAAAIALMAAGFSGPQLWVGFRNVEVDGGVVPMWDDGRIVGSREAPYAVWDPDDQGPPAELLGELIAVSLRLKLVIDRGRRFVCESPLAAGP